MDNDDAYDNAAHIEGAADYPGRWLAASGDWAERWGAKGLRRAALPYGPGERQRLDLFLPEEPARGLVVFVHGGYWIKFDRAHWFHLTRGALGRGWAAAVPSYDLCPAVRIAQITEQIARAVTTAAGLVTGPIILTGHSAGGHLVARMLARGMLSPDVTVRLEHVMPISPLSDLRPLRRTSMNAVLRLDAAEAAAESPVLMHDRLDVPVTVIVGARELPAFLDQARWLAEAWGAAHIAAADRHHFDIIDDLSRPESDLLKALFGRGFIFP